MSVRMFPLTTVYEVFGVGVGADPSVQLRLDAFLAELPRNVRVDGQFTVSVFKRAVAAGFIVWPNWFANNKATYRLRHDGKVGAISQAGEITYAKTNAGRSLMSYCKEFKYNQCNPWVVVDNVQRVETYAVVGWQYMQDSTDMYCITTNGFRTLDQNGKPVRW